MMVQTFFKYSTQKSEIQEFCKLDWYGKVNLLFLKNVTSSKNNHIFLETKDIFSTTRHLWTT